jgi:hypothetical protein
VVSTSEPPELPEPEVEYRRPAWVEPPADVVPGIVPVELILARTPQRAIGLTGIRVYPTGFGCTLHLRLREVIPGEQSNFGTFNMFGDGVDPAGEFADYYLRVGAGSPTAARPPTCTNVMTSTRARRRTRRCCGWSAGRAMTGWPGRSMCGCGACPPGPLAFVCEWPARHIPESRLEIDAGLVLEAAARATAIWPEQPRR